MQIKLGLILIAAFSLSNDVTTKLGNQQQTAIALPGTWELISGTTITKGDSLVVDYTKNQRMIKIINKTHFAFLRHDLGKGKSPDAVFESGGGSYTLVGDKYTEYLEYCNLREWEGKKFQFTIAIKKDTLIQRGIEKVEEAGINREIIERYRRVQKN